MSEERLGLSTTEPFTPLAFVEADTAVDRIRAVDDLGANGPLLIVASFRRAQQFIAAVRHGSGPATPPSRRSDRRDDPLGPECPQLSTVVSLLTPLERSMLHLLMSEEGRVWSFDELTRHAWRTERGDASRVHALVKRLRAKLAEARVPLTIESVRGVGFRVVRTAADDATTRPRGHPRDDNELRRLVGDQRPETTVLAARSVQEFTETVSRLRENRDSRLGTRRFGVSDGELTLTGAAGTIGLTPLEHGVLRLLWTHNGSACTTKELSESVWQTSHVGEGEQVRAVIKRLRRKIAQVQAPVRLEAVRGVGYKLTFTGTLPGLST